MSSCRERLATVVLCLAGAAQAQPYPGIGRPATQGEIAAWDIDVRPDFTGLPAGSGSVEKGQQVWEQKCASCHGVFGESNQVFNPLVGGTTEGDVRSGRVASLNQAGYPSRTSLMKLATLSTLWDYINRAMPWNEPKSLSVEEVYATTAYMLNLGGIVGADFVLSERNIAEVQKRMPNRHGMTRDHDMWPGATSNARRPDVRALACMRDCRGAPRVVSSIPDHARDSHGNLAEQNRKVGAQRGVDTRAPSSASVPGQGEDAAVVIALTQKHTCAACHGMENKLVGPSFRDISNKHAGRADAAEYLAGRIRSGGSGVWGAVPMPPQALGEAEAREIAEWLADGAKR